MVESSAPRMVVGGRLVKRRRAPLVGMGLPAGVGPEEPPPVLEAVGDLLGTMEGVTVV